MITIDTVVTEDYIKELKSKYGTIYTALIHDRLFIFREITRKEYDILLLFHKDNKHDIEEELCNLAVIHPKEYDYAEHGDAGLAGILSTEIIVRSQLDHAGRLEQSLDFYRQQMDQTFLEQAKVYISQAFNNISFEEMDDWTNDKLMKYLARAEWALQNIHQLPFKFEKEEESEEEQQPERSLQEIGQEIRDNGGDPMVELLPQLRKPKPYMEAPVIMGTKFLDDEGVIDRVREQIQRLSK